MTNSATVPATKAGHSDAFRLLYDEHRQRLYRLAYRYTRSPQDAEDVMQETFIRAFKSLKAADSGADSNLPAWLSSICIHCAIDHLREAKRHRRQDHVTLNDLPREPESPEPAPDRTFAARQMVAWTLRAMRLLSPGQHVIFDLRYREHLDIREIARQVHCSESSVKTQLVRATAKLRKALEPVWEKR